MSSGRSDGAPAGAPPAEPLPRILERVRAEIDGLHGLGRALEDRLGAALPPEARRDADLREALQELDRLNQSTAALSGFLARLAEAAGRGGAVDPGPLAAEITLRAMAERLGGHPCAPSPSPSPTPASGDAEFF